jgi:hypothetical protein
VILGVQTTCVGRRELVVSDPAAHAQDACDTIQCVATGSMLSLPGQLVSSKSRRLDPFVSAAHLCALTPAAKGAVLISPIMTVCIRRVAVSVETPLVPLLKDAIFPVG